ncbi:MAG TPA: hypothetical protein VFU28_14815 [Vicinamibacterales bacterium]|nr:hypothetical protein [Vicinamibacterales bacterium]
MLAPSPSMVASSEPGGSASLETFGAGRGKGHGNIGTPSSAIEPTLVGDYNADGIISWGDAISFDISTTETWNQVSLVCSQNGSVVLGAVRTPTASYPITLSSQVWQSGAADCVATLDQFNGTKVNTLASVSFAAGA